MRNEHLKMANELINEVINDYDERYANKPQAKDYVMRMKSVYDDRIEVQPTYSSTAHCFDDIIKIAEALHLHYYFSVEENQAGVPTPTINIF
ncbi:MAG: hypothetical protein IIU51_05105 [Bacteroidaceae bacterium]|nr:hypothetical protein [Bacteroidaceae bacterium]